MCEKMTKTTNKVLFEKVDRILKEESATAFLSWARSQ